MAYRPYVLQSRDEFDELRKDWEASTARQESKTATAKT
jgi:hypothetical protein